MTSRAVIVEEMLYDAFTSSDPLNTSSDPRYTITYQFAGTSEPATFAGAAYGFTGWTAYTAAEKAVVRDALDYIETFLNVEFVEDTGTSDPDFDFAKVSIPGSVVGYGGWNGTFSGFSGNFTDWDGFAAYENTMDFDTIARGIILHEIGHAMGLEHPFESSIFSGEELTTKYTAMAYIDNPDTGETGEDMAFYDFVALQSVWGAAESNTGDDTYGAGDWVIWDTGGRDWLSGAGASSATMLDLRAGKFSSIGATDDVVIAFDTRIENARGSANDDTIIGNGARNVVKAGGGADTVKGLAGKDRLFGQAGNDTLLGGGANDLIRGQNGDDRAVGHGGRDRLFGNRGEDVLIGRKGNDVLNGGLDDDILRGGGNADRFIFAKGYDVDTVKDFGLGNDKILVRNLGDLAGVKGAMSASGSDVVFDFGNGDRLIVENATLADVEAALIV